MVELVSFDLPGHQSRSGEALLTSTREVVPRLLDEFDERLDRPYAMFGYSLGGVLAFEMARLARARGLLSPRLLIVASCSAPQLPPADDPVHHLDEDEFVTVICEKYGGVTAALLADPDVRAMMVPVLRADMTMVERYRYEPEPVLSCPIVAMRGSEDNRNTVERLEAWRDQTTGRVAVETFEGGHFFVRGQFDPVLASVRGHLRAS